MKMLNGEKKILESDKGQIVLTTHRVRFDVSTTGRRKIVSMMLNEVCSCSLKYKSNTTLIILAVVSLIIGFAGGNDTIGAGIFGALVFGIAFFVTRKQLLTISSGGEAIGVETKGISSDEVSGFIDAVEAAKYGFKN